MRQRSFTQRAFTALFGIWFGLLVAQPIPLRACPMHDGPLPQVAAVEAAPLTVAADSSHSHDVALHATLSHAQPSHDAPAEHGHHQCQCLGCCAGASALALPSAPADNLQAMVAPMQVQRITARVALPSVTRFAFALPFANGPPLGASLS